MTTTNKRRTAANKDAPAPKRRTASASKVETKRRNSRLSRPNIRSTGARKGSTLVEQSSSTEDSADNTDTAPSTSRTGLRKPARRGKQPAKKSTTVRATEHIEYSESESSVDESENFTTAGQQMAGVLPPVPRTGHVSDKVKKQIRRGEFVNFSSLIERGIDQGPARRFTLTEAGTFAEIEDRRRLHFLHWIDCFVVFMSIRLEKFPWESQGLLRHLQLVKTLHAQGRDGTLYDTMFRKSKCQYPDILWGQYLPELVAELEGGMPQQPPRLQPPYAQFPRQPQRFRPYNIKQILNADTRGLCFAYNSARGCPRFPCRFMHACGRCQGQHPVTACNMK